MLSIYNFQALWFTENPGSLGPVFGSADKWKGLGIFFDSFDNDGQVRKQIKFTQELCYNLFI